jgi:hypothetical protein
VPQQGRREILINPAALSMVNVYIDPCFCSVLQPADIEAQQSDLDHRRWHPNPPRIQCSLISSSVTAAFFLKQVLTGPLCRMGSNKAGFCNACVVYGQIGFMCV